MLAKSYPLSVVIAIALFFLLFFFDNLADVTFLHNAPNRLILLVTTGYLFFFVYIVEDSVKNVFQRTIISLLLILVMGGVFWFWICKKNNCYIYVQMILILTSMLLIGKPNEINDDNKIWFWQNTLVKSIVEAIIASAAFLVSIHLVILLFEFVFDVKAPAVIREFVSYVGVTFLPCLVFLLRMPKAKGINNYFLGSLVRFIVVPLWLIYVAMLNIYALKILIHWSLPKGMVSLPVALAFLVYIASWWGIMHLDYYKARLTLPPRIIGIFRWLNIPLLALMAVAMWKRISDYGLSQPRYFMILICALFAVTLGLDLAKKLSGRNFAVAFWITCLLSLVSRIDENCPI